MMGRTQRLLATFLILSIAWWGTPRSAQATGEVPKLILPGSLCRLEVSQSAKLELPGSSRPSLKSEFSILGMERTPIHSPMAKFYRQVIFALSGWASFPQVDLTEFTPTRKITGGKGNKEMLVGELQGAEALLKVSNPQTRSQNQVLAEARWLMFLNKFGLGPEFLGLFETPEGDYGIAMRTVEGVSFPNLPRGVELGRDFSPQPSHLKQILQTGFLLRALGIE
ncbi:MAG: hypothetical protein KDD43_15270, partial [Bdellovibrionales bacterium]|nr:hypothetical protein [Bdellovibrionales bacterium]